MNSVVESTHTRDDMNVLKLTNNYGETIELKRGARGEIRIRHSDVDPKKWGRFVEYGQRVGELGVPGGLAGLMKSAAEQAGLRTDSEEFRKAEAYLQANAVMVLRGTSYLLNAEEVAMIRQAIKRL